MTLEQVKISTGILFQSLYPFLSPVICLASFSSVCLFYPYHTAFCFCPGAEKKKINTKLFPSILSIYCFIDLWARIQTGHHENGFSLISGASAGKTLWLGWLSSLKLESFEGIFSHVSRLSAGTSASLSVKIHIPLASSLIFSHGLVWAQWLCSKHLKRQ